MIFAKTLMDHKADPIKETFAQLNDSPLSVAVLNGEKSEVITLLLSHIQKTEENKEILIDLLNRLSENPLHQASTVVLRLSTKKIFN